MTIGKIHKTRDIVSELRAWQKLGTDSVIGRAADEIDRLRAERDEARRASAAWEANLAEPQEIDPSDLQALIDAALRDDRLTVRMSARDLWRMATDRRGREEE